MISGRALAAILLLALTSSCTGPQEPSAAPPVTDQTLLEAAPVRMQSPDGSMTLIFGGADDPSLILSAGFFRRSHVADIQTASQAAWAPDSKHIYVNDSGNAVWNTFRLWTVNARAEAVETATIRQAAIAELGGLNGCDSVPEPDVTTQGMGWSPDGDRVYVLAEVRKQTGACVWTGVHSIVVVGDVTTGLLLEVAQEGEARRLYPTLFWGPVTDP